MKISKLLRSLLFGLYVHYVMEGDATGGTDPDVTGAVGTGNDARVALLDSIADSADGIRAEELADVNEDGSLTPFKASTAPAEDAEDAEEAAHTPAADAVAEPRKYRIKVNGKELELSEEEMIARVQKIESADEYLRQAAEVKRLSAEPAPAKPAGPTQEEIQRRNDEEDRALVRAIQMGTEEEAAAALRKVREQAGAARPSLTRDDISSTIDERLAFNTAIDTFSKDYKDVWTDPVLKKLALDRDSELLKAGDARTYAERYASIGDEIRAWKEKLVPAAKPPVTNLAEKTIRKAAAPAAPVAAASAKTKPPAAEEEVDDDPSSVIANMAKVRGGPQWMRN